MSLDPRTPVLVGYGQVNQYDENPGGEPVERSAPKASAPKASSAPQSPATNGGEGTETPAAPAPAPALQKSCCP